VIETKSKGDDQKPNRRERAQTLRAWNGHASKTYLVDERRSAAALDKAQNQRCRWCDRCFAPRRSGGSAQRFCSARCRHAFGTAARRWVMRAVEGGQITVETLKALVSSAHAAAEPSAPTSALVTPNQAHGE
jgi:hypothetical protein